MGTGMYMLQLVDLGCVVVSMRLIRKHTLVPLARQWFARESSMPL